MAKADKEEKKAEKAEEKAEKKHEVAQTIEEQGIGAQDPYPTGSPPAPPAETEPEQEG